MFLQLSSKYAMEKIRWGMIGAGAVTERKSAPALNRIDGSSLLGVYSRTLSRAAEYAQRHGIPRVFETAESLIRDPEIDAIYIATPPDSHADYTQMAAEVGKPVYVEKPMARTVAEGQAMVDACSAAGVPLFVAYYRRALPRFLALKDLIEQGTLGEVRTVFTHFTETLRPEDADPATRPWRIDPEIAGGGRFVDVGSHTLDALDFLFGPISRTEGKAWNSAGAYPAEDTVSFALEWDSGIRASCLWHFHAPESRDELWIMGTQGWASMSVLRSSPLIVHPRSGKQVVDLPDPHHVQEPLLATVMASLRNEGTCPSTGESALRTQRVMDTVLKPYYALI